LGVVNIIFSLSFDVSLIKCIQYDNEINCLFCYTMIVHHYTNGRELEYNRRY